MTTDSTWISIIDSIMVRVGNGTEARIDLAVISVITLVGGMGLHLYNT
jgi:hypothetical protein